MRLKFLCILLFCMKAALAEEIIEADFNAISLTRFAIQKLYAPERLLKDMSGIVHVPMQVHRNINLFYGAAVTATPLISWQGGDLYVTAIELKNNLNKSITLDPRQIQGDFQTVSFFPTNTLPQRQMHETVSVFVTSSKPFKDTLNQHSEMSR